MHGFYLGRSECEALGLEKVSDDHEPTVLGVVPLRNVRVLEPAHLDAAEEVIDADGLLVKEEPALGGQFGFLRLLQHGGRECDRSVHVALHPLRVVALGKGVCEY